MRRFARCWIGLALPMALTACITAAAPERAATAAARPATALRAPAGYAAAALSPAKIGDFVCEAAPEPYLGSMDFPSKYEGSDSARDDLNRDAEKRFREMTKPIDALEKGVVKMTESYLSSGNPAYADCVLSWLGTWARADALLGRTQDHGGRSVRKWALATVASSYLRLSLSASAPLATAAAGRGEVEAWLEALAALTIEDWSGRPLDKVNNHDYWAAWAVMATAVALDRRSQFDWAVQELRMGLGQVDQEGHLPNEMKRDTRALSYHNYALQPLVMLAVFADANGIDPRAENRNALQRLAETTLQGMRAPAAFEKASGKKQQVDGLSSGYSLAWLEPYASLYPLDAATSAQVGPLRPMKTTRLGGNLSALFCGCQ